MTSLDPGSLLSAPLTNDNAQQMLGALQLEVVRLNNVLNQFKSSLDFEIGSVQGDVNGLQGDVKDIKVTMDMLNDNIKSEIVKTNIKVNDACSAGGIIDVSIQQIVSQSFSSLDDTVKRSVNEIVAVKTRVKQIEDKVDANNGTTSGQNVTNRSHKVLLEYHVINSLQVMASEKSKYKEWNDKLVNAVVQFRPYARTVLKLMRTLKDKAHDQSEVDMEVGKSHGQSTRHTTITSSMKNCTVY